jgi:hypothetical protein
MDFVEKNKNLFVLQTNTFGTSASSFFNLKQPFNQYKEGKCPKYSLVNFIVDRNILIKNVKFYELQ